MNICIGTVILTTLQKENNFQPATENGWDSFAAIHDEAVQEYLTGREYQGV